MVMFIGDSAATSWGPLYLQNAVHAVDRLVPAGLFAYLTFQFLGRTVADAIIGGLGAVGTAVAGCLVAAAGFGVVVGVPTVVGAVAGFALIGAGLSVVVPLTFSAADALDPAGTGTVIAKVNLFNYAGVVVGSILIGVIVDAVGLPGRLRGAGRPGAADPGAGPGLPRGRLGPGQGGAGHRGPVERPLQRVGRQQPDRGPQRCGRSASRSGRSRPGPAARTGDAPMPATG